MATLAGQYIRPFLPLAGMTQAKVSSRQLAELIADRRKAGQEEQLAVRIEACQKKVGCLVENHGGAGGLTATAYAFLLLSEQYDYQGLLNLIIANMRIDKLSKSVGELVTAEMEDYFGVSISGGEELAVSPGKLLPPAYVIPVFQEYVNTLRVTRVMGRAVNRVCHESGSPIGLPWLVKRLLKKIEVGSILMGAFNCHPGEQRNRIQRQVIAGIEGTINHLTIQLKNQFYEQVAQTYYRFYEEHNKQDWKVLLINRPNREGKQGMRQRTPYWYKVKTGAGENLAEKSA